ncbi:MAG: isoprenoid biosynthesis protein ElbB [Desulfuromonas sp.]|nr:MAG: isoprenoid biosynthesis protein ElbB [Desulfuromonas sp.]
MAKVGVVLCGCGVYDGSEIHEAVITLLALDRAGVEIVCMAPNIPQMHVVNHLTGDVVEGENRNVLVESARIARGAIRDLAEVNANELDAVIIPGGFGAAKNLCDFAVAGSDCQVNPDLSCLVQSMVAAKKPVGALCIAPAPLAKILGEIAPEVTIGSDAATASALEGMGAKHIDCPVDCCVVDKQHKLVTSPAYMLAGRISEAAAGIEKAVAELLALL